MIYSAIGSMAFNFNMKMNEDWSMVELKMKFSANDQSDSCVNGSWNSHWNVNGRRNSFTENWFVSIGMLLFQQYDIIRSKDNRKLTPKDFVEHELLFNLLDKKKRNEREQDRTYDEPMNEWIENAKYNNGIIHWHSFAICKCFQVDNNKLQ